MVLKARSIFIIVGIIVVSILLAYLYDMVFLTKIYDSRKHSEILDSIKKLNDKKVSQLSKNGRVRYVVYTHYEGILRNELTGAFLEKRASESYTIDNIKDLRRLKNVKYFYEDDFNGENIASKEDYVLMKIIQNGELILKAYFNYDPTINTSTSFWYNGNVLTSVKSLHTFDALTGAGISNEHRLKPLLIEEEVRQRQ